MQIWKVKSQSKKDEMHDVIFTDDGKKICSCPHWQFRLRKAGTKCKHIVEAERNIETLNSLEHLGDGYLFDFGIDLSDKSWSNEEEEIA